MAGRWAVLGLGMVMACRAPEPGQVPPTATGEHTGTPTTQPTAVGWDCEALPGMPLEQGDFPGHANEDITIDAQGYLVGADGFLNLWRTSVEGETTLVLPESEVNAGLRLMWWDGTLASATYVTDSLYRIDPETGARELMVGGLSSPSGIAIGADRAVWFGELRGDRVNRYDPATGEVQLITDQLSRPNGLTFDRDYDRLYVAATGEGHIYAIDLDPLTSQPLGEPWIFVEDAGGGIDGLSVDACGNVYAGWWSEARIERWSEEGDQHELLAHKPDVGFALGNWVWGRPEHGWPQTRIYAVEYGRDTIRWFELGVGNKAAPEVVAAARAAQVAR